MNVLRGGNSNFCSCYYDGKPGGSTSSDNANENNKSGLQSINGCNQYVVLIPGMINPVPDVHEEA